MGDTSLYAQSDFDVYGNVRLVGDLDIGAVENQSVSTTEQITTNVYVDSAATGQGNGLTWLDANPSLYNVFIELLLGEQCLDVDTVFVAKGTYYPDTSLSNLDIYLADDIVLLGGYPTGGGVRDVEEYPSILSGDIGIPGDSSDNAKQLLYVINQTDSSIIDGFEFTQTMNATSSSLESITRTFSSETRFFNCTWQNNGSADATVAILRSERKNPSFRNCTVSNNYLLCGMDLGGASEDTTSIDACAFVDNYIESGSCLSTNGILMISESLFEGNQINLGTVIAMEDGCLSNCFVLNNHVDSSAVTAIRLDGSVVLLDRGDVIIENSFFVDNSSPTGSGGAVYVSGSDLVISNSLFANNSAADGGALYVAPDILTAEVEIINSTFTGNSADAGSSVFIEDSDVDIYNSILWDIGSTLDFSGTSTLDFDHNMYFGAMLPVLPGTVGSDNLFAIDPQFVNPSDVDGPDDILGTIDDGLQVQRSSQAYNTGSNAFSDSIIDFDLAGRVRKYYSRVDIGAYELICGDEAVKLFFTPDTLEFSTGTSWTSASNDLVSTIQQFAVEGCDVDSIKMSEGVFPVATTGDRYTILKLPSGSSLVGGFNVVNGMELGRNPDENPSIITGAMGAPEIDDNAYRLITFEDYLDTTRITGVRLVEAVDSAGSAIYAPVLAGNAPVILEDVKIGNHKSPVPVLNNSKVLLINTGFQNNKNAGGGYRGIFNTGIMALEEVSFTIGEAAPGPNDKFLRNIDTGQMQIRGDVRVETDENP